MKILVIGSNGMAGHVIVDYLRNKGYSVDTSARKDSDINIDIEELTMQSTFFQVTKQYDFIINCTGLLVKDSCNRPDKAIKINSWFPHAIEQALENSSTKLIHLSTDCVFNGSTGNYTEHDLPTETNFYGKSKSLGEVVNNKDVTFRMSIIGPEIKENGTGLFHWLYTSLEKQINGWDNALWNGLTTLELAKCIETYINNPKITGLYHLVNNSNKISKYELLSMINDQFNLGKIVVKTNGPKSINKILIDTRQELDFEILGYTNMLSELKEYMANND